MSDYKWLSRNLRICASGNCHGCSYSGKVNKCSQTLLTRASSVIEEMQLDNDRLKRLVDMALECTKAAQRYVGLNGTEGYSNEPL